MGIKKIVVAGITMGVIVSFCALSSAADSTGWKGSNDDGWQYYTSDTDYVKDDWKKIDGKWYYFDEDGYAVIDAWAIVEGKLYHFDEKGAMETGKWIECGDHDVHWWMEPGNYEQWQQEYMNKKDWRYVGDDGVAYTGWHQFNGDWYYFYTKEYAESHSDYDDNSLLGLMAYGDYWDESDDSYYNFDSSGKMRHDCWYQGTYGDWYYFGSDGRAYSGWHQIDGKWYMFGGDDWSPNCLWRGMRETYDNGYELWYFDENGVMQTGWIKYKIYDYDEDSYEETWNGKYGYYYARPNGSCYHNEWLKYNNSWYYFDSYGRMVFDVEDFYLSGKFYDFDANGKCTNPDNPDKLNGWYLVTRGKCDHYLYEDNWSYAQNGVEYRDRWLKSNGSWYYFKTQKNVDGLVLGSYMVYDVEDMLIDGKYYSFDENGKCLNPDSAVSLSDKTGWIQEKMYGRDYWFFYGEDGVKYTNRWLRSGGKWYYFGFDGIMATGLSYAWDGDSGDGVRYCFDENGAMVTGWYEVNKNLNEWVYAGSDGILYTNNWLEYNGSWYYFDRMGYMCADEEVKIDGKYYEFDSEGKCVNPYSPRVEKLIILMGTSIS